MFPLKEEKGLWIQALKISTKERAFGLNSACLP
jgi:hypothetical protein